MKNNRIDIISLGSAIGLDGVGWRIVEQMLHNSTNPEVSFHLLRDPTQLPALLATAERALLVDAAAWPWGEVRSVTVDKLAAISSLSSHALSVPEAIKLALQLNPALEIGVVGIGIEGEEGDIEALCDRAMPEVVRVVQQQLAPS